MVHLLQCFGCVIDLGEKTDTKQYSSEKALDILSYLHILNYFS